MATLKTVRQQDLFLFLKRDLALVSFSTRLADFMLGYPFLFLITYSPVVFVQTIQEVFTAEEWMKDAQNEAKVEANLRAETNKALGIVEQKIQELTTKVTTERKGGALRLASRTLKTKLRSSARSSIRLR